VDSNWINIYYKIPPDIADHFGKVIIYLLFYRMCILIHLLNTFIPLSVYVFVL